MHNVTKHLKTMGTH